MSKKRWILVAVILIVALAAGIYAAAVVRGNRNAEIVRLFQQTRMAKFKHRQMTKELFMEDILENKEKIDEIFSGDKNQEVIITVGGTEITRATYEYNKYLSRDAVESEKLAVWDMIEREILYSEAKKRGLASTQEQVEEYAKKGADWEVAWVYENLGTQDFYERIGISEEEYWEYWYEQCKDSAPKMLAIQKLEAGLKDICDIESFYDYRNRFIEEAIRNTEIVIYADDIKEIINRP